MNFKKKILPMFVFLLVVGIFVIGYEIFNEMAREPAQTESIGNVRCGFFCGIERKIKGWFVRGEDHEFTSTIPDFNFQLIRAAGKSFMMGSPSDEDNRNRNENGKDGKQVEVTFTKDFEIMTTEITQKMWFDVMDNNPSYFNKEKYCRGDYISQQTANAVVGICPSHPVERVSWNKVQVFIKKLNDPLAGCQGTANDPAGCYRLPTEAEWEFAARAESTTAYYFGDDASLLEDHAWYRDNSNAQTHPVGKLASNDYGLFDMSGNVWEWTQDSWQNFLVGGEDPLHTSSGSKRVIRGGSWGNFAKYLRSAFRYGDYGDYADHGGNNVGLRLVRTL